MADKTASVLAKLKILKPCSGVALLMTEIASNGLLRLPKMRICRNDGNIP